VRDLLSGVAGRMDAGLAGGRVESGRHQLPSTLSPSQADLKRQTFLFGADGNRLSMEIGRPERQYEIEPLEEPVPREEPAERPDLERDPALPALEPLTT